jgi:N-acetylmuramoyl-L-alanine amidase
VVKNSTLVPIRVVAEGLGYDVTWSPKTRLVTVFNGVSEVQLTINQKKALVNGTEIVLDSPAIIDGGTTYIPLRFVGENLGLDVYWDARTRAVHLYKSEPTVPPVSVDPVTPPGAGTDKPPTGPNPTPDPTGSGGAVPADALALITSIEFDGSGRVSVNYDGQLTPNQAFWVHNPERLVIDIPNAAFSPEFSNQLAIGGSMSQGSLTVDTLALQQVRYSYYSDSPSTVRIVLDLLMNTEYSVSQTDGQLNLDLLMSDMPVPPVPVPETTPDGSKIYKVVLDAGHGDQDPGAKGIGGRLEKNFNLAVTLKIKALLDKEKRIRPYLTRSDDTFVTLDNRALFANNLKADLFISIHANSAGTNAAPSGTETYYSRTTSTAFADVVHKYLVQATGLSDRKVRQAGYVVIKKTTMPAILLESGYLSNRNDEKLLFTEAAQNKIAAAVVKGIKEYLKV